MASFFFDDYHFPSELYNRETGDFTAPIRTLLDFAPHILKELPKEEKDQKPIHSEAQDSWTKSFVSNAAKGYFSSLLTSDRTKAITEFVLRAGNEYLKSTSDKKYEREQYRKERRKRRRENENKWFYNREQVSSSSEEEEEEPTPVKKQKSTEKSTAAESKQLVPVDNSTMVKSAIAASVLSLSLYSTYQASVAFSDISFHNQLALLITQVQSIIQSTEVWIEEHDTMNDKVPNQVRSDLIYIKQLIDDLSRLDPRANKKVEAAGWGFGAVGGLSALGGVALGSAAVATGGAALAVGGVIVMISAKAQNAGKGNLGARILLENQVREKVKACEQKSQERKNIIEKEFDAIKEEKIKESVGEKKTRKANEPQVQIFPSVSKKEPSSSSSSSKPVSKKKTTVYTM